MALHISISTPSALRPPKYFSPTAHDTKWSMLAPLPDRLLGGRRYCRPVSWTKKVSRVSVRANLEVAAAAVGQVTEVNKDTFWPIVEAAGEKVVVLDMYTQWCGPCKVIAPKYHKLSEKHLDVVFLKLDCNQDNKVSCFLVPTYKILKNSKVVKEVTGAKIDDLVLAIEAAKTC